MGATTTTTAMTTTINTARQVLADHGFRLFTFAGAYTVSRQIPAYGSKPPAHRFHRNHRGFEANNGSLTWVRRLADAITLAEAGAVTPQICADAWAADRKAEIAWGEAAVKHRDACSWRRPDYTLTEQQDLGVAELRTGGASRMALLTRQVLVEGWQEMNPIEPLLARMGSQAPRPALV